MQDLLETTAIRLLRAREQFTPLTEEGDMLTILLAAYDDEDRVALGVSRVLDRWLSVLAKIETDLSEVQDGLSLARQAAEPVDPEQTPAEKLATRRWQASRIRDIAADLEREGEAEFAAATDQGGSEK